MVHLRFSFLFAILLLVSFSASGQPKNMKKTPELTRIDSKAANDSLRIIEFKQAIEQLKPVAPNGVPVVIDGDTLFSIYVPVGEISPERRAESVQNDILALGKDRQINPDSIRLVPTKYYTGILFGGKTIMSVTESDAIWLASY